MKQLTPQQMWWAEFLVGFEFEIKYRPGTKAIRLDALSRLLGDRLASATDERLTRRYQTMLLARKIDSNILADLKSVVPVQLHVLDTNEPINGLINCIYKHHRQAMKMIKCLRNDEVRSWPREINKYLHISIAECYVVEGCVYFYKRLFIPDDPELHLQVLHQTHSTPLSGYLGQVKTLNLLTKTY